MPHQRQIDHLPTHIPDMGYSEALESIGFSRSRAITRLLTEAVPPTVVSAPINYATGAANG
jgi:hypothetical protein